MFTKRKRNLMLLSYVDDCIIAGSSSDTKWLHDKIKQRFEIKVTDLEDFLGFSIKRRGRNHIELDMRSYIKKSLDSLGLGEKDFTDTPLPARVVTDQGGAMGSQTTKAPYQEYLGKLLWITKARPDLDFAVNTLCRFNKNPTTEA